MFTRMTIGAFVVLTLLVIGSDVHAFDPAPATLDDWVLRPDIWAIGTIVGIEIKALDGSPESVPAGLVRLQLEGVQILASRISVSAPLEIAGVGSVADDGTSGVVIRHVTLETGSTYLFSLQGGAWRIAPFVHDPMELDVDGVRCAGGAHIYAFGPIGPVCGNARTMYGQPMSRSAFEARLVLRRDEAGRRWPAWAAALDQEAEPLAFGPTSLPTLEDGLDSIVPISAVPGAESDGGAP